VEKEKGFPERHPAPSCSGKGCLYFADKIKAFYTVFLSSGIVLSVFRKSNVFLDAPVILDILYQIGGLTIQHSTNLINTWQTYILSLTQRLYNSLC